jgi:type IV pilus assembly protein PilB
MTATYQDRTFADILVDDGLITPQELNRILGERDNTTEPIGDLLARLGHITEKQKARCVGKHLGIPFVDLEKMDIDAAVACLIPHSLAVKMRVIPIERSDTAVSVAMVNPLDITAIDALHVSTGLEIDPVIATEEDIQDAVFRAFGVYDDVSDLIGAAIRGINPNDLEIAEDKDKEAEISLIQLKELSEGAPVIRLVNALILRAIGRHASDIHINPERNSVRVRYRVDGMLQEAMTLPKDLQHPMASRLKIMASMDIAERRAPQDGRLTLVTPSGEYDFRLSTYPALHGENIVIRILDKRAGRITLNSIGMQPDVLEGIERITARPQGMFLVCGPTGSGKTTTLYACLNALNSVERNIMTIEDPIEYQLPGIIQGNVNVKAGVTFVTGMRTLVRQDPDIILVGEIRDTDTARIAIQAALTGHFVLSTIHANDAASAITRLFHMGIEPFLLASALTATLAQRLMRCNCARCVMPELPNDKTLHALNLDGAAIDRNATFKRGTGCEVCGKTGYKGRTGIHELLEVTPEVQSLIMASATSQEIKKVGLAGRRTLREDALLKACEGQTTLEEVLRVTVF